jgi:hypothetical protein
LIGNGTGAAPLTNKGKDVVELLKEPLISSMLRYEGCATCRSFPKYGTVLACNLY